MRVQGGGHAVHDHEVPGAPEPIFGWFDHRESPTIDAILQQALDSLRVIARSNP